MIGYLQDPTLPETITRLLGKIKALTDCRWFALIDTAFDYEDGGFNLFPSSRINCYEQNIALEGLQPAAPCLIALDPTKREEQVQELVKHCDSRPMLSFLAVEKGVSGVDMSKQWSNLHWAKEEDGKRFLLRFADTRSLAHLPKILKPEQWQAWHQNVSTWCYINRKGTLVELPLPKKKGHLPGRTELDNKQFAQFVELTEPDAVLNHLDRHAPKFIPKEKAGSWLYEMAERSALKARQANIDIIGESALLLLLVFETNGRLLDAPELDDYLKAKQWETETLYDLMKNEDWFKSIEEKTEEKL